ARLERTAEGERDQIVAGVLALGPSHPERPGARLEAGVHEAVHREPHAVEPGAEVGGRAGHPHRGRAHATARPPRPRLPRAGPAAPGARPRWARSAPRARAPRACAAAAPAARRLRPRPRPGASPGAPWRARRSARALPA